MKTRFVFLFLGMITFLGQTTASVKSDIEDANKSGHTVFLIVTDPNVTGTDKAIEIANHAKSDLPESEVIQMNRSDAANTELVSKYRLGGAPLPLILVITSNGIVSAGFNLNQATPELLVKAVPSPKKAEVLKTLSEGKSVFMVISAKSMKQKSNIMNTCQQACIEMEYSARMIEVDQDDPQEQSFLKELKVPENLTEPQTFVINSKGQVTGAYSGEVNTASLVAKAKKVGSSCCPGGSSKGCK